MVPPESPDSKSLGILSRRDFIRLTALGAIATTMPNRSAAGPTDRRKPNFLVILADDMGFSDPGCYGGEIETPSLNRLASNGLRFTQHYSTGRCWPSRASILTGFYAQQVRMDPPKGRLPAWTRLAPHYLKQADYRCYHSGKWHIKGAPKAVADGGFDHSYRLGDHNRYFSPQKHWEDDQPLPAVSPEAGYYATTAIADHAIRCLKEHAQEHSSRPFFHYLCFTSPHFPLHALQDDIARYRGKYSVGWDEVRQSRWRRMRDMGIIDCELSPLQPQTIPGWNLPAEKLHEQIGPGEAARAIPWRELTDEQRAFQATKMAIHAAMIDRMDREIGRVVDQLKTMGAYENTAILVISDNGASAEQIIRGDMHDPAAPPGSARSYLCLGPGWSTSSNTPFRLHKSWVHEGGIASPLIVHWPAGLRAQAELRHNPGHFIDLLPTVLDLAGITPSPTWNEKPAPPFEGRSLAPALTDDGSVPHEFLFFHHSGNRAIRMGDWKLVAAGKDGPWELFNLRTDRSEINNLAERRPAKARELSEAWEQHESEFRRMAASEEWPPP